MNLAEKYDLYKLNSGGGCLHFGYNTEVADSYWLINDVEEDNEPSQQYPTDENQLCMFGYSFYDLKDESLYPSIWDILIKNDLRQSFERNSPIEKKDSHAFFLDTLKNGVPKMKAITEELNTLTRENKHE